MLNHLKDTTMKKTIFLSLLLTLVSLSTMAMSRSKIRNHARFLTDRMAYELDFTPMQYDDCYEINYDFIYAVAPIMDDAAHGYYDAINAYYRYLDWRNDDLRYIMTSSQYIRFMSKDYFYRPLYTRNFSWYFRIYTTYSNRTFFYYDAPSIFKTYRGAHSRSYISNGYYTNRYPHLTDRYNGNYNITGHQNYTTHRTNDFGTNLRERNQKPDYNNYGNRNSNNRTADSRYRDNSGNQNSPLINNRSTSGEHRGASSTRTSRSSSTQTTTTSSGSSRGASGSSRGSSTTTSSSASRSASSGTSTRGTSTRGSSTSR